MAYTNLLRTRATLRVARWRRPGGLARPRTVATLPHHACLHKSLGSASLMRRLATAIVIGSVSSLLGACGNNSPTAPSARPSPPPIVQAAGLWRYTSVVATVSGSDCAAQFMAAVLRGAQTQGSVQVTQVGAAITARATEDTSGLTCDYQGTAGTNSLTLNGTGCDDDALQVRCPNNGPVRFLDRIANVINADVAGAFAVGTGSETWAITTPAGANVGVMLTSSNFRAEKR